LTDAITFNETRIGFRNGIWCLKMQKADDNQLQMIKYLSLQKITHNNNIKSLRTISKRML